MALAHLSGDHTMKAIAEHFGVHYVTVSRAVRWLTDPRGKRVKNPQPSALATVDVYLRAAWTRREDYALDRDLA